MHISEWTLLKNANFFSSLASIAYMLMKMVFQVFKEKKVMSLSNHDL